MLENQQKLFLEELVQKAEVSELGSLKSIVGGILKIINDPESTAKELKEVLLVDPPLTAKVLTVANSAYYGARKRITEIDQAVIWVGFEALKEISLNQKVCSFFKKDPLNCEFSGRELWRHSVAVAMLSKMIFRREFGLRGETLYAIALLHDIGLLVLKQFQNDIFQEIIEEVSKGTKSLIDLELEKLGFNHFDIGRELARAWGLPHEIVEVIGAGMTPLTGPAELLRMNMVLYVANCAVQNKELGFKQTTVYDQSLFYKCMDKLGLSEITLDVIVSSMYEEFLNMEDKGLF